MALVVDIETAGLAWESFDKQTQKKIKEKLERSGEPTDTDSITKHLALSPYTGQIITIGILDSKTEKGAVFFQAPGTKISPFVEGRFSFKVEDEPTMLTQFWKLASRYEEFVTFNGRAFDAPFLMIRSAVHKIKPSKDLMRGRYFGQQAFGAQHTDLYDLLSFYGSFRFPTGGSLQLACQAFGIDTPKKGSLDGSMVGEFFAARRYREIAQYNARDLLATNTLYNRWRDFLVFK